MQVNKTRNMTDAEISHTLQMMDVADRIGIGGEDNLSGLPLTFFGRLSDPDRSRCLDMAYGSRFGSPESTGGAASHSLIYQAMNQRKVPARPPEPITEGLTVADIAARMGMDKETTTRLLEANGWLDLAPYAGGQQRRLVPDAVILKGYGANLTAGLHGVPFPVFSPEHVGDIIWSLGWDTITEGVDAQPTKKGKAAWLFSHHGYLPNTAIADLSGAGLRTIKRNRPSKMAPASNIYRVAPLPESP